MQIMCDHMYKRAANCFQDDGPSLPFLGGILHLHVSVMVLYKWRLLQLGVHICMRMLYEGGATGRVHHRDCKDTDPPKQPNPPPHQLNDCLKVTWMPMWFMG